MDKRNAVVDISVTARSEVPLLGTRNVCPRLFISSQDPPPWVWTGAGSDPALCSQPGGEQLREVFKGEQSQPPASPPASVRRGVLGPPGAGMGKFTSGTTLFHSVASYDVMMLWAGAGRGESRKVGGAHPCPRPLETPPPVVHSGDSIHVKPTFLEPKGPARSSHTGRLLSCLMRK